MSRITQLAHIISNTVAELEKELPAKGVPIPSFDESSPVQRVPLELAHLQFALLEATSELHDLFLEPLDHLRNSIAFSNAVPFQAIARYDLARKVPFEGRISYDELGKQTALGVKMTRRLVRHAITMRVFCEPEPGYVAHTQVSKLLANREVSAWTNVALEDLWPSCTRFIDAHEKWPDSQEPNQTGHNLATNSSKPFYEHLSSKPKGAESFALAMNVYATNPAFSPSHVVAAFDWQALVDEAQASGGKDRIQVVDIGGSHGPIAVALVQEFADLDVTVQDMEDVVKVAEDLLPTDLAEAGRVKFMVHDLFQTQTAAADVYLFRWIMHNWSDKNCIAILRAQIPMLREGSRILVMETHLPEAGQGNSVPLVIEQSMRSFDVVMGANFNSRERTVADWRNLFTAADSRLKLVNVTQPKGSALAMLEVVWEADQQQI